MKKKSTDKSDKSKSDKIQIKGPSKPTVNFKPTLGSEEPTRYVGQSQAADTLTPNSSERRAAEAEGTKIIEAVVDITQRRKRSNQMRRLSKKLARLRMFARNQMAPEKRLQVRAAKMARNIVRSRFAGSRGANYKDLTTSDKIAVDRMISNKAKLIARLANRVMPVVRKAEQLRLQGVRTGKKPKKVNNGGLGVMPRPKLVRVESIQAHEDMIAENIAFCLLEGKNDRIDQLLRAGLADRDSLMQYKKALNDPELAKRYSLLRDKAFDMLNKLIDTIATDPTIFYRAKDNIQKKHDFNTKNDKKQMKEELVLEKKGDIHPSLKNTDKHPSHEGAKNREELVNKENKRRMALHSQMNRRSEQMKNKQSAMKSNSDKKKAKPAGAKKKPTLAAKKPLNRAGAQGQSMGSRHKMRFDENGRIKSITWGANH